MIKALQDTTYNAFIGFMVKCFTGYILFLFFNKHFFIHVVLAK